MNTLGVFASAEDTMGVPALRIRSGPPISPNPGRRSSMKKDPMKPSVTLLIKIGSAMIHAEEMVETKFKNLDFDLPGFQTITNDPEVIEWVKAMGPMLPRKRSTR